MMDSLRRAIIALTLLVLGGGHAACACAAVAQAVSLPAVAAAALTSQDAAAVTHHAPDADHCDPASQDDGHDCAGCEAVALPSDSSTKAAGVFPVDFGVLPARPADETSRVFKLATSKFEPARGPPRPSPSLVTLKVRLQN
jgi:hypothetical protein